MKDFFFNYYCSREWYSASRSNNPKLKIHNIPSTYLFLWCILLLTLAQPFVTSDHKRSVAPGQLWEHCSKSTIATVCLSLIVTFISFSSLWNPVEVCPIYLLPCCTPCSYHWFQMHVTSLLPLQMVLPHCKDFFPLMVNNFIAVETLVLCNACN